MKIILSSAALVALSACADVSTPCRSGALTERCDDVEVSRDKDRYAGRAIVDPANLTPEEPTDSKKPSGGGGSGPISDGDEPAPTAPPVIVKEPDSPVVADDPDKDNGDVSDDSDDGRDDDQAGDDDRNDDDDRDDDDRDDDQADDDDRNDKGKKNKKDKSRKGHNHGWGDHTAGNGKGHDKSH